MPESGTLEKILNRIGQLDDKFSNKFNQLDRRIDNLDERFDKVDQKFIEIDEKFIKVDENFDLMDERFDKTDHKFDNLNDRLDMIYNQTVRLTIGQASLKMDINEIKNIHKYLSTEVARNSKDIYVMKNKKNK